MTIATLIAQADFAWTGAETSFSCGFPARRVEDVSATLTTAGGEIVPLTRGAHYTLALASGSMLVTLTPTAFPVSAGALHVQRDSVFDQQSAFEEGEAVPQQTHQDLHDFHVLRLQELRRDATAALARSAQNAADIAYLKTLFSAISAFFNLTSQRPIFAAQIKAALDAGFVAAGIPANSVLTVQLAISGDPNEPDYAEWNARLFVAKGGALWGVVKSVFSLSDAQADAFFDYAATQPV